MVYSIKCFSNIKINYINKITVNHGKLIHKLQAYGVDGNLLSLITDFLGGRSQRVILPGGASTWKSVFSGVPQGSILGPLLFLIYIHDVSDLFHDNVSIKLFASDIKNLHGD